MPQDILISHQPHEMVSKPDQITLTLHPPPSKMIHSDFSLLPPPPSGPKALAAQDMLVSSPDDDIDIKPLTTLLAPSVPPLNPMDEEEENKKMMNMLLTLPPSQNFVCSSSDSTSYETSNAKGGFEEIDAVPCAPHAV